MSTYPGYPAPRDAHNFKWWFGAFTAVLLANLLSAWIVATVAEQRAAEAARKAKEELQQKRPWQQ